MQLELFVEQLAALASQLATIGQQGVQPIQWDAFLGLLCQKLKERKIQAAVLENRQLQLTLPAGNCVFTVEVIGRVHPLQIGPTFTHFRL